MAVPLARRDRSDHRLAYGRPRPARGAGHRMKGGDKMCDNKPTSVEIKLLADMRRAQAARDTACEVHYEATKKCEEARQRLEAATAAWRDAVNRIQAEIDG